MERAIDQRDADIDDRKAERPALQVIDNALLHRRNELAWHDAALDLILKYKAGAARHRLDVDMHVAELAMTAGLALVTAMLADRFADCLAIRHLRRAGA